MEFVRTVILVILWVLGSIVALVVGLNILAFLVENHPKALVVIFIGFIAFFLIYKPIIRRREKREQQERERREERIRQQKIQQQREEKEQQKAWDSFVKRGDEAFERKDYERAIKYYKEAGEINRTFELSERLEKKIAKVEVALARERGIYIRFLPTGKEVDIIKPEEQVRQKYIKQLVEDYRYDIESIKIEVAVQIGSSSTRCDIAIFDGGKIVGIVETKSWNTKLTKKRRDQLESYMSATPTCKWGVLTNGDKELCGYRNFTTGEIHWGKKIPKGPKLDTIRLTTKMDNGYDVWRGVLSSRFTPCAGTKKREDEFLLDILSTPLSFDFQHSAQQARDNLKRLAEKKF
ncbi:MAG: type I restriction enzyme HsdR N-terminal domain-containing protein [Candidatus Dadabacteria bacterium]|nr:type I restriction enzyme HsdR N-terminal domain-containing protein [Candidatus Dadabacteria bacterium]